MTKRNLPRSKIKRVYDPPATTDGCRVLVDRVWPRSESKDRLKLDQWPKKLAPTTALRKWFNHDRAKWKKFNERYFRELDERPEPLEPLLVKCHERTVTLLFAAKDTRYNNAVALKTYVERRSRK